MTNRKLITALVAANGLLACSNGQSAPVTKLEYETGWIRFTEDVPEPKPVISSQTPVVRHNSENQSRTLPVPPVQVNKTELTLPVPDKSGFVYVSGKDVPLLQAMHQVVPKEWRIRLSPDVARSFKKTVSWPAGAQWPKVLNDMLSAVGLHAEFADQDREIKVVYRVSNKSESVSPTLLAVNKANASHSPVSKPTEPKMWKIDKGLTLKDGFIAWTKSDNCPGKDHKWNVQWKTDINYPIDYPLSFSGSFEEATTKLFNLYQKAQSPLYVSAYRNQCIIIIDDRN